MELKALERAVNIAGSQTALAAMVTEYLDLPEDKSVKQAHVWNWLNRDRQCAAAKVIAVEAVTGVPRHELRPDRYPPPTQGAAA